ncbi:hypothetical protein HYT92_01465 [Candidatus Pacearchaeota archaeon]|nr:hypothetical protein [Candidatus Pacearchaeota archaeon]
MIKINSMHRKKAVSEVIATVLIILIVITAIAIITPILINFARSKLTQGQSCFDMLGKLSFDDSGYACSNSTGTFVTINVGDIDIDEIKAVVYKSGSSTPLTIKNGTAADVEMFGGNTSIQLPPKGGSLTYALKCSGCTNAESASLIARANGRDCDQATDTTELSQIC